MAYCRKCGAEIFDEAVICPKCGVPVKEVPQENPSDKGGFGWAFLGFLIPLLGLILYIVWKKDMPKRAKSVGKGALVSVILGIALSVILVVASTAVVGVAVSENSDELVEAVESAESQLLSKDGGITMEQFNTIETGMTYEEVVAILGSEGSVLSEVDTGMGDKYKTTMYSWDGDSLMSSVTVTVQGGKVVSKAQVGLE